MEFLRLFVLGIRDEIPFLEVAFLIVWTFSLLVLLPFLVFLLGLYLLGLERVSRYCLCVWGSFNLPLVFLPSLFVLISIWLSLLHRDRLLHFLFSHSLSWRVSFRWFCSLLSLKIMFLRTSRALLSCWLCPVILFGGNSLDHDKLFRPYFGCGIVLREFNMVWGFPDSGGRLFDLALVHFGIFSNYVEIRDIKFLLRRWLNHLIHRLHFFLRLEVMRLLPFIWRSIWPLACRPLSLLFFQFMTLNPSWNLRVIKRQLNIRRIKRIQSALHQIFRFRNRNLYDFFRFCFHQHELILVLLWNFRITHRT